MKNLVVGTANFNFKYGVSNYKVKNSLIKDEIIPLINQKKIKYLDISLNYGIPSRLCKYLKNRDLKIIIKIKLSKFNQNFFIDNLEKLIKKKLLQYNQEKFYAIMLHDISDLKTKYGKKLLHNLKLLKRKKLTSKIGISIYRPYEIKNIYMDYKPDIIQIPLSPLNQSFIKSKYLNLIKSKKTIIQVRSIFLQGLILNNKKIKNKNIKIYKMIKKFDTWCKEKKISKLDACLFFLRGIKKLKLITVGFNSNNELKEIMISFKKKYKKYNFNKFHVNNNKLTDPRTW